MEIPKPSFETELYEQELLEQDIENWLDAIEDIGVFEMRHAEKKTFGKRTKLEAECIFWAQENLEGEIAQRSLVVRFTSSGLDSFELHYKLVVNTTENTIEQKTAFYSDVDGNDSPLVNFHYVKWCKILGLKSS